MYISENVFFHVLFSPPFASAKTYFIVVFRQTDGFRKIVIIACFSRLKGIFYVAFQHHFRQTVFDLPYPKPKNSLWQCIMVCVKQL